MNTLSAGGSRPIFAGAYPLQPAPQQIDEHVMVLWQCKTKLGAAADDGTWEACGPACHGTDCTAEGLEIR